MRVRQMSDLHLEFDMDFRPLNNNNYDMLMLNGDICVAEYFRKGEASPYYYRADMFRHFFEIMSKEYEHVLYISGNHEHYHGYINLTSGILKDTLAEFPNITHLDNEIKIIDDICFVGSTMWTSLNNGDPLAENYIGGAMNDFRLIKWKAEGGGGRFLPRDSVKQHKASVQFIDNMTKQPNFKYVVMSHHAPSYRSVHPRYHNDTYMNYGYYSDLDEFIMDRPQIKLWTHGHMHACFDYNIGNTRVVCNPKGYGNENPHFKLDNLLEI